MALLPTFASEEAQSLNSRFLALKTWGGLADFLEVPPSKLTYFLWGLPPRRRYSAFVVTKRAGGERVLHAPHPGLKVLQRKLLSALYVIARPRGTAHGFVPGRGIWSNARVHVGKRFVFKTDLEDFFPSINFGRVYGLWLRKPFDLPPDVAKALAQLCCHENRLPQGAPTSPFVANLICRPLDRLLEDLAVKNGCKYTRYADDISFSTNLRGFPASVGRQRAHMNGIADCGPALLAAIRSAGFDINPKKTWLFSQSGRQLVTGLVVNEKVNPRRKMLKAVRGIIRECERTGFDKTAAEFRPGGAEKNLLAYLKGTFSFLADVQRASPVVYNRLVNRAAAVVPELRVRPMSEEPHPVADMIAGNIWVVESTKYGQGTAFLLQGVGLVTCWHVVKDDQQLAIYLPESGKGKLAWPGVSDQDLDLAILEPCAPSSRGLRRSRGSRPRVLEEVRVVGCPQHKKGASAQIKVAHIQGIHPHLPTGTSRIQLDCGIVGGMSGGPVLDLQGDVVGVAVKGANEESDQRDADEYGVIWIGDIDRLLLKWKAKNAQGS